MVCMFFIAFLHNSCNFQYFILGWSTLVLGPSYIVPNVLWTPLSSSLGMKLFDRKLKGLVGCMVLKQKSIFNFFVDNKG